MGKRKRMRLNSICFRDEAIPVSVQKVKTCFARYSKEAQTAFDDLVRYVNGWHVVEQEPVKVHEQDK